jgi:hypothetical protein
MNSVANVVAIGSKTEPLVDQSKVVALIKFINEQLVVTAADLDTARQIMNAIVVPVWGMESVEFGDGGTLWRRVKRHPGTRKHFRALGETNSGRSVLEAIGYVVFPPWSALIQVPLPSFSAQVVHQGHPTNED